MKIQIIFITSGISGLICVLLGAFATHALRDVTTPKLLSAFKTGIEYQFYHTLVILFIGVITLIQNHTNIKWLLISFIFFIFGIILFSGSLYLLAITKIKFFGPLTPIGGLCFIIGWIYFLWYWIEIGRNS